MSADLSVVQSEPKRQRRAPRKPGFDVVLNRQQVVELAGYVSAKSIKRLLAIPSFPRPHFDFSNRPKWMKADVLRWLKQRAREAQQRETTLERA